MFLFVILKLYEVLQNPCLDSMYTVRMHSSMFKNNTTVASNCKQKSHLSQSVSHNATYYKTPKLDYYLEAKRNFLSALRLLVLNTHEKFDADTVDTF